MAVIEFHLASLSGGASASEEPASVAASVWDGVAAVRADLLEVRKQLRYLSLGALVREPLVDERDLVRHEGSFSSQNGEDGVLQMILHRVGSGGRRFVEIGAHAAELNCAFLADVLGWHGAFIDADPAQAEHLARKYQNSDAVTCLCAAVTPSDIDGHLIELAGDAGPDVLSIDVDGNDYWLWHAVQSCRPPVVVIEYNSAWRSDVPLVQVYSDAPFDNTERYGASLAAMIELGHSKGYVLVHAEVSGTNLFFLRSDLLDGQFLDESAVIRRGTNYHLEARLHAPVAQGRQMTTPPA